MALIHRKLADKIMNYKHCMKYKCKFCGDYLRCEKVLQLQNEAVLLYKPFENLKEILEKKEMAGLIKHDNIIWIGVISKLGRC